MISNGYPVSVGGPFALDHNLPLIRSVFYRISHQSQQDRHENLGLHHDHHRVRRNEFDAEVSVLGRFSHLGLGGLKGSRDVNAFLLLDLIGEELLEFLFDGFHRICEAELVSFSISIKSFR